MIRAAAGYIVRNGPTTQQDRWEEDSGYSAFTLAVEISALLAAADAMEAAGKSAIARYLRETADGWNEQIEDWAYATDTELSRRLGIDGYYMRIGFSTGDANARSHGLIPIRNRSDGNAALEAGQLVSPDALALVRFGLRAADDPRILNTVRAIDDLLRRDCRRALLVSLQQRWLWRTCRRRAIRRRRHRPALAAADRRAGALRTRRRAAEEAKRLLAALEASASTGGLLPEQIWDSEDIPRTGTVPRAALRQRDAVGLGACGACQTAAIDPRRRDLRHAAADLRPLCEQQAGAGADGLADRVKGRCVSPPAGSCAWNFRMRRGSTGRRITGKRFPTGTRPQRGWVRMFATCRPSASRLKTSSASRFSGRSKIAGKAPTSRSRSSSALERFQARWKPVRVRKTR